MILESVTIAVACNKVTRKRFLKPNTIGLNHSAGYTGNVNYNNEANMWFVYREQTDGSTIMHDRKGGEYRTPELHRLSVDGFCSRKRNVDESIVYLRHRHTCLTFRNVNTIGGATLAARYEQSIARLQRKTIAG